MIGVFVLVAVIFALVIWLIVWFIKRSYRIYAERWAPLAALVSGTHKGSKMTGTYEGRTVEARISGVSDNDNNRHHTTYDFHLKLAAAPGSKDWKVIYGGEKLLGFGEKRWHVSAKDDALKERLNGAGVVAELANWHGYPIVSYKAKRGEFEYQERVGGMYDLPSPERFAAQLELLARLARVNEQVNAA